MRENPELLKPVFDKFYDLYYTEFKGQWLEKELKLATDLIIEYGLEEDDEGNCDCTTLAESLEHFFSDVEGEKKTNLFIGTRSVTLAQFKVYSKGLYFMAAYRLFINNKL